MFAEKYNQINRKEYLENAELIIKTLDVKNDKIDKLKEKITLIVNKVNDLTDRNTTIKMDQDEYRKKYKKLAAEYNKLKDELDRLKLEDKNK